MDNFLQYRSLTRRVLVLGCLGFCLCLYSPRIAWSESEAKTTIHLADGTVITVTDTAVVREHLTVDSGKETVLWSVPAQQPQLPLVFEDGDGLRLVLYFSRINKRFGEFHAIRVEDGQKQWMHPLRMHSEDDPPIQPVFADLWIYFGRGMWLEKMDPDDGKIVERFPARVSIQSLEVLPDGAITVHAEAGSTDNTSVTLHFQDGRFSPYIAATGDLLKSLDLFKRAELVMDGFVGVLGSEYTGYLDLHRIKKEPLPPEFAAQWQDFDLQRAETAYQHAYHVDRANPYFALYLALAIYYQDRQTDAEAYFQEAFRQSANFWEESLRLGGICESLGLRQWADAFYEQGAARYFQEVPVPSNHVWLIEVLIHFFGQRQSAALYADGQLERALYVLNVRRQIFPHTEGDTIFSLQYASWLRSEGREEEALLEEQRLENPMFWDGFEPLSPSSFLGFLAIGLLLFGLLILKNEAHHPYRVSGKNIRKNSMSVCKPLKETFSGG